jgi:two-component system, NarL family, response regulator
MSTASQRPIRLLLVDDHVIVRAGLKTLLESQPGLRVVAEAGSGMSALDQCAAEHPDIVLMDLRMPGMSGVETTAAIQARFPNIRVIVLTTFGADEDIYRAVQAGARAYLLKTTNRAELVEVIKGVHQGDYRLAPEFAARLAQRIAEPQLSARELEVLQWIVRGQSNKEIAATLNLAENTVKNHVKTILEKLHVKDRTQAATTALQRGLVHLE